MSDNSNDQSAKDALHRVGDTYSCVNLPMDFGDTNYISGMADRYADYVELSGSDTGADLSSSAAGNLNGDSK